MKEGRISRTGVITISALIVVLSSLAIVVTVQARHASRRDECRNHMKQLGVAFKAYDSKYHRYPTRGPKTWFQSLWVSGVVSDP
jgi:hypothetical protein